MYQVFDGSYPAQAWGWAGDVQPIGIGVPRSFVCAELAHKPTEDGGSCGREKQAEGPLEGADSQIRQGRLDISRPSQFDRFESVDKAGENEE